MGERISWGHGHRREGGAWTRGVWTVLKHGERASSLKLFKIPRFFLNFFFKCCKWLHLQCWNLARSYCISAKTNTRPERIGAEARAGFRYLRRQRPRPGEESCPAGPCGFAAGRPTASIRPNKQTKPTQMKQLQFIRFLSRQHISSSHSDIGQALQEEVETSLLQWLRGRRRHLSSMADMTAALGGPCDSCCL